MKSLMLLWQSAADDLAAGCDTSTTRDYQTVTSRVKDEGLSFLTITLANFGKDFERSLDLGFADRNLFQGFTWRGGLPLFLGGFLDRVFDRGTGRLLDDPCVASIHAVRQLTLMFSKIGLPCTEVRERKAIRGYVECESDVMRSDENMSPHLLDEFSRMSLLLWADVLGEMDNLSAYQGFVPKHGSGQTADRLLGNKKFTGIQWTTRLETVFKSCDFLIPNHRYSSYLSGIAFAEPEDELPVKVTTVPKTLKTPRIIAMEPTCMMYTQQAVMEPLVSALERSSTFVGFTDQVPNQHLALQGSREGDLATLDLSEASDRVSNQHVLALTRFHPHFSEALQACRSRKADVPGYGVLHLAKFASMGSALCFPMEAMVFTTLVFLGIQRELRRKLTHKDLQSFVGKVRVYGDDIIVPVDYVSAVVSELEAFGYRVNAGKSFWTGRFRESCGKEYYAGHDVSIVKVRSLFPTRPEDAKEVVSTVSTRNQFYKAGMWKTAALLDKTIASAIKHYPVVAETSPVVGRFSFLGYETQKMHRHLHSPLVKGYVVKVRLPDNSLDGEPALLKWFLKRGCDPLEVDHLRRSGRPLGVRIKLGMASAF